MKIVINSYYGGFDLSEVGVLAYARHKGLTLFPEDSGHSLLGKTYYIKPADQRAPTLSTEEFYARSFEERVASNVAYRAQVLCVNDIPRDDPALVATVEELGPESFGRCADLKVVEVPDDVKWHIAEYDGLEHVAEDHRTWS